MSWHKCWESTLHYLHKDLVDYMYCRLSTVYDPWCITWESSSSHWLPINTSGSVSNRKAVPWEWFTTTFPTCDQHSLSLAVCAPTATVGSVLNRTYVRVNVIYGNDRVMLKNADNAYNADTGHNQVSGGTHQRLPPALTALITPVLARGWSRCMVPLSAAWGFRSPVGCW